MKNTKIIFSGIMAAILSTGAASAAPGIASVDYVDAQKAALTTSIDGKADKADTLAGYGITDAYTKEEVYNKGEVDDKVADAVAGDMGEALKSYVKTETYNAQVGDVNDLSGEVKVIVTAINNAKATADAAQEAVDNKADKTEVTRLGDQITNLTNNYNDLADSINDEENGLAGQVATNTENIANNAAELAKKANADDVYTKAESDATFATKATLGSLATAAPASCAKENVTCALTFDGTNYAWEEIVRGPAD